MMYLNIFQVALCKEKKQKDIGDIYDSFLEKDILLERNSWNWTVSVCHF